MDTIANLLLKNQLNDYEFADVVWRLDDLINVDGIRGSISGFKPIILNQIKSLLK
jgi:hypothetical protein